MMHKYDTCIEYEPYLIRVYFENNGIIYFENNRIVYFETNRIGQMIYVY